jgi:hypothetical protein
LNGHVLQPGCAASKRAAFHGPRDRHLQRVPDQYVRRNHQRLPDRLPTADEIWSAAKERPTGLTRTEVSDMFSRNKRRREIERALGVLEEAGRLRRETRQFDRGRPAEIWLPVLADAA